MVLLCLVWRDHRPQLKPRQGGIFMKCNSYAFFQDTFNGNSRARITVDLATATRRVKQQQSKQFELAVILPKACKTFHPPCVSRSVVIISERRGINLHTPSLYCEVPTRTMPTISLYNTRLEVVGLDREHVQSLIAFCQAGDYLRRSLRTDR